MQDTSSSYVLIIKMEENNDYIHSGYSADGVVGGWPC